MEKENLYLIHAFLSGEERARFLCHDSAQLFIRSADLCRGTD